MTTYKDSGVDIDAGDKLVKEIKPFTKKTANKGSSPILGGFGALFDIKPYHYKDPVLVASTDGVGTKLKIALETNNHKGIGQDLVAMSVNDLVVQGAQPLFFLDYYATSKLDVETAKIVIKGVAEACNECGCALIGGETAEMPGIYHNNDYDLAGFAVGIVERNEIIDGHSVIDGDIIIGLHSNGLHSNGFSLVRKILADNNISYNTISPFSANMLATDLLEPTRLYAKICRDLSKEKLIKAFAHITGGGLIENIPRVIPQGFRVELDATMWSLPPIMKWLSEIGSISSSELTRTFNCGIGMIAIISPINFPHVIEILKKHKEPILKIGKIIHTSHAPTVTVNKIKEANWPV